MDKKTRLTKLILALQGKWQLILSAISLLAIIVHFALKKFAPISADLSLYAIIFAGGATFSFQIFARLLQGKFGADIVALLALILAIYLQENLTCALIILMLSSGQALEEFASKRASFILSALAKRMPAIVHLANQSNFVDIGLNEVKVGDLVAIFPHEICPVDGEIIQGSGSMDESYLSGEPYKIKKTTGSKVLSGAINGDSLFVVRTEKLPQDSRYAKIVEVIRRAEEQRPEIRRLADKIGAVFAPLALLIAGVSYLLTDSATNFLAVLTIATPCPLLIAVPIAIISAISIAAQRGIIIKDPGILERLPTCSTAIFDKTGTLTYGEPALTEIIALADFSVEEILQKTASLERYSRHPLAGAILKAAKQKNLILLDATNVAEKPGEGMFGNVAKQDVLITNRKNLDRFSRACSKPITEAEAGLECFIIINQIVAGILRFRDEPRAESHGFINHLAPNHGFKKVILLSGDHDSEVSYLAKILGIKESYSSQTPEQKLSFVSRETALAPTLFMGDGINDAAAIMAATAGIAFGQNNSVTSESASAVILENNLQKVDELIHISDSMRKIALQSALGGMILSLIGMGFAACGMISPAMGALFQQIIDFLAIINSLRLAFGKKIVSDSLL